jgi:hypothetical protein
VRAKPAGDPCHEHRIVDWIAGRLSAGISGPSCSRALIGVCDAVLALPPGEHEIGKLIGLGMCRLYLPEKIGRRRQRAYGRARLSSFSEGRGRQMSTCGVANGGRSLSGKVAFVTNAGSGPGEGQQIISANEKIRCSRSRHRLGSRSPS